MTAIMSNPPVHFAASCHQPFKGYRSGRPVAWPVSWFIALKPQNCGTSCPKVTVLKMIEVSGATIGPTYVALKLTAVAAVVGLMYSSSIWKQQR